MLPHWSAEKVVNPEIVRKEMVNVISRAFDRDPVFNWIVKQDHRREERIRLVHEKRPQLTTSLVRPQMMKGELGLGALSLRTYAAGPFIKCFRTYVPLVPRWFRSMPNSIGAVPIFHYFPSCSTVMIP
jgi:hypothetical protein